MPDSAFVSQSPPPRSPSKNDITLADIQAKWMFRMRIVDATKLVFVLLASAVPLWALYYTVHEFAGKTTNLNVGVNIGVGITLAGLPAIIHAIVQYRKTSNQAVELVRCRERATVLEGLLKDCQEQSRKSGASK